MQLQGVPLSIIEIISDIEAPFLVTTPLLNCAAVFAIGILNTP